MRIRLWRESIPWIWVSETLPEEPLRVTIPGSSERMSRTVSYPESWSSLLGMTSTLVVEFSISSCSREPETTTT